MTESHFIFCRPTHERHEKVAVFEDPCQMCNERSKRLWGCSEILVMFLGTGWNERQYRFKTNFHRNQSDFLSHPSGH